MFNTSCSERVAIQLNLDPKDQQNYRALTAEGVLPPSVRSSFSFRNTFDNQPKMDPYDAVFEQHQREAERLREQERRKLELIDRQNQDAQAKIR